MMSLWSFINVNICWMVWVDVPIRSVNISWINPRDWCCRDLFEISILADNYIFNRIWLFIPKWDICWVPPAWPCSSISRPGGGSCLMWGKASLSGLSWYHMLCGEISFQFLSMTCTPHPALTPRWHYFDRNFSSQFTMRKWEGRENIKHKSSLENFIKMILN